MQKQLGEPETVHRQREGCSGWRGAYSWATSIPSLQALSEPQVSLVFQYLVLTPVMEKPFKT